MVVISIISLLASIITVQTVSARTKAIDVLLKANAKTFIQAVDAYYQDQGTLPMTGMQPFAAGNFNTIYYITPADPAWNSVVDSSFSKYLASMPPELNKNGIMQYIVYPSNYTGYQKLPDQVDYNKCLVTTGNSAVLVISLVDPRNVDDTGAIKYFADQGYYLKIAGSAVVMPVHCTVGWQLTRDIY